MKLFSNLQETSMMTVLMMAYAPTNSISSPSFLRNNNNNANYRHHHRLLSFDSIAGYEPFTVVTDLNAIDLDVSVFVDILKDDNNDDGIDVRTALQVYNQGGYVRPIANLTILDDDDNGLKSDLSAHVKLIGKDSQNRQVIVHSLNPYSVGSKQIQVRYDIAAFQANYVGCHVGALGTIGKATTRRCLRSNGTLETLENGAIAIPYTYDVLKDNGNNITLASLSLNANITHQSDCSVSPCQYNPTFSKFVNYYGKSDYGDYFIRSALGRKRTEEFSHYIVNFGDDDLGESANVQQAVGYYSVVLLNIFMEVIGRMEQSIRQCRLGNQEASKMEWDAAVAFYTGSLEGPFGSDNEGNLLHELADSLCPQFGTCGKQSNNHNKTDNKSFVNRKVLEHFRLAQRHYSLNGELADCNGIQSNRQRIEQHMIIPLIQGTLLYTHQRTTNNNTPVARVTASAFAAALLPFIFACSNRNDATMTTDADMLLEETRPDKSDAPNFGIVKDILERHYICLDVTCNHIGGVLDPSTTTAHTKTYFEGASPCDDGISLLLASSPTRAPTFTPAPQSSLSSTILQVPTVGPGAVNPGSVSVTGTVRIPVNEDGGESNNDKKQIAIIVGSISGVVVGALLFVGLLMYFTARNKSLPPKMEPATLRQV